MKTHAELLNSGAVLREPAGHQTGYWVGAPGTFIAAKENAVYLTYRIRRPRGVHPDRGGEVRIARSTAGGPFTDIWQAEKTQFNTASIERCAVWEGPDNTWRYFVSFVDPADGRWMVSVIRASDPSRFDPAEATHLFRGADFQLEGVKDPWIFHENGRYYMLLSVALPTAETGGDSHSTLDIFNTGQCLSATALAVSEDLQHWDWQGVVFRPESSSTWDSYCRRINSVVRTGTQYIGFYDGSASHAENYEEKCGIAVSSDLKAWKSITPDGPKLVSPNTTHSARYFDARISSDALLLFYEWARPDGAHELRFLTQPNGNAWLDLLIL